MTGIMKYEEKFFMHRTLYIQVIIFLDLLATNTQTVLVTPHSSQIICIIIADYLTLESKIGIYHLFTIALVPISYAHL